MANKNLTLGIDIEASGFGGKLKQLLTPGKQTNMMGGLLGGQLGGVGSQVGGMVGQALGGPIGAAIGGKIGGIVGGALEKLIHPIQTFEEIAAKVSGYVQAANPQQVERYNLAVKDLTAVFGHMLIPAMQTLEDIVRAIGDSVASSDLGKEMKGLFRELGEAFQDMKPALMLFIRGVADSAATLARVASVIVKIDRYVAMLPLLRKLAPATKGMEGASRGLSAQSVNFVGAEEFGKSAAIATLSTGKSPAERTADNTQRTAEAVETMRDMVSAMQTAMTVARFVTGH